MYWRAFIREDDGLTPGGGLVKPGPQQYASRYHGKLACYDGDPVYCNTCKSWGVTQCVPPYRPHTDPEGRQANLDGDLCLCKCPTPPRLKASFDNVRMGFEEYELAQMPGSNAWLAYAGYAAVSSPNEKYGKVFEFKDSETGEVLANRTFIINDNGVIRKAKTNSSGKAIIEATAGNAISIHLVFESPNGEINYEA